MRSLTAKEIVYNRLYFEFRRFLRKRRIRKYHVSWINSSLIQKVQLILLIVTYETEWSVQSIQEYINMNILARFKDPPEF